MSDLRKAAEMALIALEANQPTNYCMNNNGDKFPMLNEDPFRYERNEKTITALRQALAQPEYQTVSAPQPQTFTGQKPALWLVQYTDHHEFIWGEKPKFMGASLLGIEPLYTAPPKREWVGLNENEFEEILEEHNEAFGYEVYESIEAKLKEKNT